MAGTAYLFHALFRPHETGKAGLRKTEGSAIATCGGRDFPGRGPHGHGGPDCHARERVSRSARACLACFFGKGALAFQGLVSKESGYKRCATTIQGGKGEAVPPVVGSEGRAPDKGVSSHGEAVFSRSAPRPCPASGNGGAQPFIFLRPQGKASAAAASRCRPVVPSLPANRFSGRPQEGRKRVPRGFPGLSPREGRMGAHCRGTRLMVCKQGCSVTGRLAPVPKVTHCSGAKRRTGP